jgi:hypothetical protein
MVFVACENTVQAQWHLLFLTKSLKPLFMNFTNFQLFDEITKPLLLLFEDRHQRFI